MQIKPICMFIIPTELVNTLILMYFLCLCVLSCYHEKINFDHILGQKVVKMAKFRKNEKFKKKNVNNLYPVHAKNHKYMPNSF